MIGQHMIRGFEKPACSFVSLIHLTVLADKDDIIDEILGFFKANVLFKHFEVKGGVDRVLIYLILYTTQCLQKLEKSTTPIDGLKAK